MPNPTARPATKATVELAKGGSFTFTLRGDKAPRTVERFAGKARNGFYDNLTFHRVEDWVVQGGDPKGTGTGGDRVPSEYNDLSFKLGAAASQLLGESQRSVARLFERTLPDLAARGRPTIVLLDEVESLAVSRSGASLDTNPVDVHRATDAVLEGVDKVARRCPNVTFVATTNHRAGVDEAFLSRADLIEEIGLPDAIGVERILADTIAEVVGTEKLDEGAVRALAEACVVSRLDARRVRKLVLRAIASRRDLALAPERLVIEDVAAALRAETNGARP